MQGVICPLQLSLLRKTDVSLNRSCLSPRSRLRSSPWGIPPKGGFPHETLPPGRAGRISGQPSCGCGSSFSEPVTQNTKRFVRCFWALDKNLAYARHYPAINWNMSYSEYSDDLAEYYNEHVGEEFCRYRQEISTLLVEENNLMEIVKLIGADVLPDDQKLILEIAKVIRLGFLQQNAFHKEDTCVPLKKQFKMMEIILYLYKKSRALVAMGMPVSVLKEEKIFEKIIAIKYDVPNDRLDMFDDYKKQIDDFYNSVIERNA